LGGEPTCCSFWPFFSSIFLACPSRRPSSLLMRSSRVSTLDFASIGSCLMRAGPTSLNTLASSGNSAISCTHTALVCGKAERHDRGLVVLTLWSSSGEVATDCLSSRARIPGSDSRDTTGCRGRRLPNGFAAWVCLQQQTVLGRSRQSLALLSCCGAIWGGR